MDSIVYIPSPDPETYDPCVEVFHPPRDPIDVDIEDPCIIDEEGWE